MLRTLSVLVVAVILALGCGGPAGPPTGDVQGTVTFDGQPVDGSITFRPTGGTGATAGDTIKAGKYRIAAVAVGSSKVEIVANRPTGKKVPDASKPGSQRDEVEQYIPARYNTKTELLKDVTRGPNTIDFPLTSK